MTVELCASSEYRRVGLHNPFYGVVSMTVKDAEPADTPLDLVVVVDRSGSMQGEKMVLLQEALSYLADQLSAKDRMGLVSFAADISKDVPLSHGTTQGKRALKEAVSKLRTRGSTNLGEALLLGLSMLGESPRKGAVGAVMLCTDGRPNVGEVLSHRDICEAARLAIPRGYACFSLHTFGFGADHDPRLLFDVADLTGGCYHYVRDAVSIPEQLAGCLAHLMGLVASQLELEVHDGDEDEETARFKVAEVLSRHPVEGRTVRLGDLDTDGERHVLVRFEAAGMSDWEVVGQEETVVLRCVLRYTDIVTGERVEAKEKLVVQVGDGEHEAKNDEVELHILRYEAAKALGERTVRDLEAVLERLEGATAHQSSPVVQRLIKDVRGALGERSGCVEVSSDPLEARARASRSMTTRREYLLGEVLENRKAAAVDGSSPALQAGAVSVNDVVQGPGVNGWARVASRALSKVGKHGVAKVLLELVPESARESRYSVVLPTSHLLMVRNP